MNDDPATAAAAYVRSEHAALIEQVGACADAVATKAGPFRDGRRVATVLEATLRDRGLLDRLVPVLRGALEAAGLTPVATPVAGPPYVVVTSRGPLCRASTSTGRLVVSIRVFDVERGDRIRYVRTEDDLVVASLA